MSRHAWMGVFLLLVAQGSAHAATLFTSTFFPNRDTVIIGTSANNNSNYGLNNGLSVGALQNPNVAPNDTLIGFSTATLPATISVQSVTLRLVLMTNQAVSFPRTINAYEISVANGDWVQGDGVTLGGTFGPTWNFKNKAGSVAWAGSAGLSTPGVDYTATPRASVTLASNTLSAGQSLDLVFSGDSAQLTALMNAWKTPSTNTGLMLRDPAETGYTGFDRYIFRSWENSDPIAPRLIVTYYLPEPASLTLLGAGAVLMFRRARENR